MIENVRYAERRKSGEVDEHDRPEQRSHARCAVRLDEKQADQDDDGDRNHQRLKARLNDRQALDGRQHRDRGSDHRVPVEERGGEHSHHHEARGPFLLAEVAGNQRQQCEGTALALVVGAHRDEHIFQRHDDHQRPEDQAEHAEDVQGIDGERVRADKAFLHRVEGRGADIAVDDTDRAEHQRGQRMLVDFGSRVRCCSGGLLCKSSHGPRDVRCGRIKIPCGFHAVGVKNSRESAPGHSTDAAAGTN